jgi:sulfite exporter TauE/SafE
MPVLPWVMALGFVVSAFDLGSRLPPLAALAPWAGRLARAGSSAGPVGRALALGAATPLLPCGLLWGMFLVAIGAGTPSGGALVMALFALGGTPGLATVQAGAAWTGRWPRAERFLRVAVPLVAAAALVWRALMAGGGSSVVGHHHSM